jgi:hypothetical protein
MLLILEEDFHAFAARLHWIMFRTGQLQFLHLENTMGSYLCQVQLVCKTQKSTKRVNVWNEDDAYR